MRIALYTRLSPNPKKKDTVNQERELEEFVKRNDGWEIVKVYTDIHVSGSKKGSERPQFEQMMIDASKKKFDLLLFWALDRLSREGVLETLQYLRRLENYKVEYRSYTEPYFDSCGAFKDVIISIASTLAKQERAKLIDRTLVGIETARAKGKIFGRPKVTRMTENNLHPVKEGEIKQMRLQGLSLREIGKRKGISAATVMRMLRSNENA